MIKKAEWIIEVEKMREEYERWFIEKFGYWPISINSRVIDFCWEGYQAGRKHSKSETGMLGRKPLSPDQQTVVVTLRMRTEQRERLRLLGGPAWVRQQIDEAEKSSGSFAPEDRIAEKFAALVFDQPGWYRGTIDYALNDNGKVVLVDELKVTWTAEKTPRRLFKGP